MSRVIEHLVSVCPEVAQAEQTGAGAFLSGRALLTSKEREVFDRIVNGDSNRAMSIAVGVSTNTIKYHLKNIFQKLQVGSRVEICALHAALRLGESRPSDIRHAPGLYAGLRRRVSERLHAGASTKQMARELRVSTNTIKFHIKTIYRDLDANCRTQAIALLGTRVDANARSAGSRL